MSEERTTYGVRIVVLKDGSQHRQAFPTDDPDFIDEDATRQIEELKRRQRRLSLRQIDGSERLLFYDGAPAEDLDTLLKNATKSGTNVLRHLLREITEELKEDLEREANRRTVFDEWEKVVRNLILNTYMIIVAPQTNGDDDKDEAWMHERATELAREKYRKIGRIKQRLLTEELQPDTSEFNDLIDRVAKL